MIKGKDYWANDPMYTFVDENERSAFKTWFYDNCIEFKQHITYPVEDKFYNEVLPGGCYGSGQYISKNQEYDYAEGIVEVNGMYDSGYIPHAFNICGEKKADFTYKKILKEQKRPYLSKMPENYYGVIIPKEYINGKREDAETPNDMNTPLIIDYWRSNFKKQE